MEYNVLFQTVTQKAVGGCLRPEKAKIVLYWLAGRCWEEGLSFDDGAWESLVNHVCGMVDRSLTGEVPDIDPALFTELDPHSLALAKELIHAVGDIAEQEAYLVATHFEQALTTALGA